MTDTKTTSPAKVAAAKAAAAAPRVEPVIAAVRTDIPVPAKKSNRGSTSAYPFDTLPVGGSFGVANKTAAQLSSIVSNANRKAMVDKTDANGAPVFKQTEMKDANGTVIGHAPTTEREKVAGKRFFAVDVDPKTDPDNAKARVFREA